MKFNVNEILKQIDDLCVVTKELESAVNTGYLKRNFTAIFLGEPDKVCMDTIIDHGGVIIDHRLEHGVLFGVPPEWILDPETEIPETMFGQRTEGVARLLIPDVNPILVYTQYNEKVYVDKIYGEDFRECHTHTLTSILSLPIEKNTRIDQDY